MDHATDRAWCVTTEDLELLPEDGMRYELIDGQLLVTPASSRIHLTVLELDGGTYVERAVVCGDEVFVAEQPFPVKVVPGELSR